MPEPRVVHRITGAGGIAKQEDPERGVLVAYDGARSVVWVPREALYDALPLLASSDEVYGAPGVVRRDFNNRLLKTWADNARREELRGYTRDYELEQTYDGYS